MAEINNYMNLLRLKTFYRNKFIILCPSGDTQTLSKYKKYQIIDINNQPPEMNLIFVVKGDKKDIRKLVINREIITSGKSIVKINAETYLCRIVNARNFPIVDSSYFTNLTD